MTKEKELLIISSILTKLHQHSYTPAPTAVLCECFSFSLSTHLFEAGIIINYYVCLFSNTENPKECGEKTESVA